MAYKPHRHLIIGANTLKTAHDTNEARQFISDIIKSIDMKVADLGDGQSNPIAWYCNDKGNEGLTAGGILTTSHIMMHFWEDPNRIEFDLYSCSDFDPEYIFKVLHEKFTLLSGHKKFINRETGKTLFEEEFTTYGRK